MISHWFQSNNKGAIRPERLSKGSLWHQVYFIHDDEPAYAAGDILLMSFDSSHSNRIKKQLYQFNAAPSHAFNLIDCGCYTQKQFDTLLPLLKDITDCGALVMMLCPPPGMMKHQIEGVKMASIVRETNLDDDIYLRTPSNPLLQYLGTQRHLVAERHASIEGHLRLSDLHEDLTLAEPCIRESDAILFNCDSISASDAGYLTGMSTSGLNVVEACQLFRYAGASQSIKSVGIYGYDEESDEKGMMSNVIAQMIWYFIEGTTLREDPEKSILTEYIVQSKDHEHTLHFYKSEVSGRWWIENKEGHKVACSYHDYRNACEENYSGLIVKSLIGA